MMNTATKKRFPLTLLGCGIVISYVITAVLARFNPDEFEHMHTAWYLLQGDLPYVDFFQHHNPLTWLILAPVIAIFGETGASLIVARLVMVMNSLLMVFFVGKTAALMAPRPEEKRQYAGLACFLVASSSIAFQNLYEIRPDSLMTTYLVVAFYHLFAYMKTKKRMNLYSSGLWMGVCFCFLQKVAFFLVPYVGFVLLLLLKKQVSFKDCLLAALAALLPLTGLGLYLFCNGLWLAYYENAIVINAHQNLLDPNMFHLIYPFEWIVPIASLFVPVTILFLALLKKKPAPIAVFSSLICVVGLAAVCFVTVKHKQYFYPLCPFMAIAAAGLLLPWFPASSGAKRQIVLLAAAAFSFAFTLFMQLEVLVLTQQDNRQQLARLEYIMAQTQPGDMIYDGNCRFNVYRRDVSFFWYSQDQCLIIAEKLAGEKLLFVEDDIYSNMPKIISTYNFPTDSEVYDYYEKGEYNLFLRVDEE